MKNCFRRIIALVIVFVICCSSMHVLNISAINKLKLSNKCETIIDVTGKEGGFGKTSTALRTSTTTTLSSAMDLSNSDLFEFDIYIEDIDDLNKAFEYSLKIEFNFSSNKRFAFATANSASADISKQLVSNGWNHIEIAKSSFVEDNIDWSKIRHYYLSFADETKTLLNDLCDETIKIKNLCESFATPQFNDGNIILFDDAIFGAFGENSNTSLDYIGKTFNTDTNVADISNTTFLKLDIFIIDFAKFNSFISNKNLKFIISSNEAEAEYIFDGAYFPTTVSNWYTIQLPIKDFKADDDFDFKRVTKFRIEVESDTETTVGSIYDLTFAFANIRGVEFPIIEGDIVYGNEVENYNIFKKVVTFGETYGDFITSINSDFPALADAENIEFDLYINSLDNFKNYFVYDNENNPVDANLDLIFSQDSKTIKWSGIEDLILDKGWNHIILSVEDAQIDGFDITKNFNNLKLEISGVDNMVESANFGEFIVIDNVVSTKGIATRGELNFDKVTTISNGKSQKLGNTFAPITQKLNTSIDITDAKMVEFDIYIQNFDMFKNMMGQKGITDISLRLSSNDSDDYSQDSACTEISDQIFKNGWNHLSISLSEFNSDIIEDFDLSKVIAWELVFSGNSSSDTDLLASQVVAVRNIVATDIEDPELPENADPVISQEGKKGVYGELYSEVETNSLISLSESVDITKLGYIQFDIYIPNFHKFKKLLSGSSNELKFGIGTTEDNKDGRVVYEFVDQVIAQGWNRIKIERFDYEKYNKDGNPNFSTVYYAFLTFGNDDTPNEYKNLEFEIKNICSIPGEYDIVPSPPENYVLDIWKEGMCSTWGINYVDAKKIFSTNMIDNPVDISDIDSIEFDIYIKDYNSFIEAAEKGALRFVLGSNKDDMNQNILVYKFIDQVTHDGWNHIEIKQSSYIYNWNADLTNIKWVYLTMWSSSVQNSPNPLSKTVLRIANVVGTHGEYRFSPALPDNVVNVLGDQNGPFFEGNTVGQKYHFTLDRIYKERFSPIDFSKTNKIEFDIYIDDYEKFLDAENDPDDYRNSKLAFEVSSTRPALWDQYSAPRHYFSSAVNIAPYVSHSGWNHIVVGKQDFTPVNNGGVDWSAITAFLVFYRGSSNVYPVDNPYSDLYVRVGNIVNTGIVSNVTTDNDQPLKKDKSAVYINSAEGFIDNIGAWNTLDGYISTDYKTEGTASIHQEIDYTENIEDTKMSFIFDTTVDMSDLKTLKFDYFIDIPQFLNKGKNTIQIVLGKDRFINNNYFYWEFSPDNLKAGWNELSFDIDNVKRVGEPSLERIKSVTLRFTELSLDIDNYAVIVNGIDNLRYISSTGNKTLRVDGWDDDYDQDFDFEDDNQNVVDPDVDEETESEINDGSVPEQNEENLPEMGDESIPEQNNESVPEQNNESVPEQNNEPAPEQNNESAPEQNNESVPEQNNESVPEQNNESVPEQNNESIPEQNNESVPEQNNESVLEQNNELIPEQNMEIDFDNFVTVIEPDVQKTETIVNKTGEVKYNKILEKRTVTEYTVIIIVLVIEAVIIVAGLVIFTVIYKKRNKKL